MLCFILREIAKQGRKWTERERKKAWKCLNRPEELVEADTTLDFLAAERMYQ